MRSFILLIGFLIAYPAFAQISFLPAKPPSGIVTVLSDAISEPTGEASKILNEISVSLDKEGVIRLLPTSGYGGPANVRDLLQLRGTDLAIINNDVLAYLNLAKALPDAKRKVRLISPLFQQCVFLFGRENIASIRDLQGRKIGVPANHPSRAVTAKTLLGALKIEAEIVEVSDRDLAKKAVELDGLLFYESDLPRAQSLGVSFASNHLIPITVAGGPLAEIYLPKKFSKAPIGNTSGQFETVQVSTLLAVYDWRENDGRYDDVAVFVNKFFSLVPNFRSTHPSSPFSTTDVRQNLPGWKRFGPAEAPAAAAPPAPLKDDNLPLLGAAIVDESAQTDTVKVMAVVRPPFANAQDRDGGLISKILAGALGKAGLPLSMQWVDSEKEMLEGLTTKKTADVGLFWQTAHCDAPLSLSATEAELCDSADLTDPLMQAVLAVFTRIDTPPSHMGTEARQAGTLCVPESQTVPREAMAGIPWVAGASVKFLRPKTLIDCLIAVDARQADALIAIEPEARFAIDRLKLSQSLQISQRLDVTTGIHAVVAKDNPRGAHLIQTINGALEKFKASGGYSTVMASHLADLTGIPLKQP